MSDEQKEKERPELATDRLLHLLRAQQTDKDTEKKGELAPEETVPEKPSAPIAVMDQEPDSPAVQESKTELKTVTEPTSKSLLDSLARVQTGTGTVDEIDSKAAEDISTIVETEIREEVKIGAEEKTEETDAPEVLEPTSTDLLKETKSKSTVVKTEIKEEVKTGAEEKTEIPVSTKKKSISVPKESISVSKLKKPSQDILQKPVTQKPETDQPREQEIEPEKFDSSLLSYRDQVQKPSKQMLLDYISHVTHFLNESSRKVTIHCGERLLRYLQIIINPDATEVEKFAEYSLPYTTDEKTIKTMPELLSYVLDHELDHAQRKSAYGALYSSRSNTKAVVLQTPPLKSNELLDLINWNVKKIKSINSESCVLSWEVTTSPGDASKNIVVVGVGDNESIKNDLSLFRENKIKLRLASNLPILLWKSFVNNYPDRKEGCYVLIHIGEEKTTIAVVEDQRLIFVREIVIGADEFYKAVMQRIVTNGDSINIDYQRATDILKDYGIPRARTGVIRDTQISLYKISIFLRPIVERLSSELNRSLNYFKKEKPTLEWSELIFSGIGATFPNLLKTIKDNLNLDVALMNPLRNTHYVFNDNYNFHEKMIPNYTLNFALASDAVEKINILPKKLRANYKFIFLHKVALAVAAFFIPFFVMTSFFSSRKADKITTEIQSRTQQWEKLSGKVGEYFNMVNDMEILGGFRTYLANDRIHSVNQIKLLKLMSSIMPLEVKLTSLTFSKEIIENKGQDLAFRDLLQLRGFVEADVSVINIHLTNFLIKLESLPFINSVAVTAEETSDLEKGKLFFTLMIRY